MIQYRKGVRAKLQLFYPYFSIEIGNVSFRNKFGVRKTCCLPIRIFIGIVNLTNYSSIHAHACDANRDYVDVHVLQGYEYAGANAICGWERYLPRANGYDASQNVDGSGYVP